MPIGKVKWFEASKGFGFIATDEGEEVYVHASALPEGLDALAAGERVEFGVADGRKGPQALNVVVLEAAPSVARARRRPAEERAKVIDDLAKVLESVADSMRKGRYPAREAGAKIAAAMRTIADELEA